MQSGERLLDAKLDSLYKHVGRKKAKVDTPRMVEGNNYYYPKYVHKKNEALYVANLHNNVTH